MFAHDEDQYTYYLQNAFRKRAIDIIAIKCNRLGIITKQLIGSTQYPHWQYVSQYSFDIFIIAHVIFAGVVTTTSISNQIWY